MLRDHPGRAIGRQDEADGDVSGGRRRADRIEHFAGVAREQLPMHAPAGGTRRDLLERVLRQRQLRGRQGRHQRGERGALLRGRHPLGRNAVVAAEGVDVVLAADRRRGRFDGVAVIHVERHQRLFHGRHRRVFLDHRLVEAIERGAADGHDPRQLGGHVRAVVPLVDPRRRVGVLVRHVDQVLPSTHRPRSS